MQRLDLTAVKCCFSTHIVPETVLTELQPRAMLPGAGNLVLAEVVSLGKHTTIEDRNRAVQYIYPGDRIVGVFGNRYATDQYEGYVPAEPAEECDLLSIGGVCGEVVSQHAAMPIPTRLRVLGTLCDRDGVPVSLRSFGLRARIEAPTGDLILVVGASMNAGKTTTAGTLARALNRAGFHVAAAKLTGTAASKDGRFYAGNGARPVLDFVDGGYPSTYMLGLDELLDLHRRLLAHLWATGPDYIVVEVADGIFQRETRMLLECAAFRATIDHVVFAATDSLSAECGARCLRVYGLPVRAVSGLLTASPLAMREAEASTGLPCLSTEDILAGKALTLLADARRRPDELPPDRAPALHLAVSP